MKCFSAYSGYMQDRFTYVADKVTRLAAGNAFGRVAAVQGLTVTCAILPHMAIGSRCSIMGVDNKPHMAEVIGFTEEHMLLMPYGTLDGIAPGCKVQPESVAAGIRVNNSYIGRVLDAFGNPIDDKGLLAEVGGEWRDLKAQALPANKRMRVEGKLDTGIRALNTFLPICKGQRLGIFSGSGVGKSMMMSMIAKFSQADVNVIGLVGERGREVKEFIDQYLGEEGMRKSIVVVATSDEPPLKRRQAAWLTMSIAEYFRDCGFNVMLMLDSVTRFALAQREIGLASGEPPTTRGFTPSVFAELPKLMERAGPGISKGSISAFFTVLVEGSDLEEPVADAVRGILDGHVVLTRELAERNHFPAIDILKSVSRMVPQCLSDEENDIVGRARQLLATHRDMEELIRLGAYTKGSDPQVDEAMMYNPGLTQFLKQKPTDHTSLADSFTRLKEVLK